MKYVCIILQLFFLELYRDKVSEEGGIFFWAAIIKTSCGSSHKGVHLITILQVLVNFQ